MDSRFPEKTTQNSKKTGKSSSDKDIYWGKVRTLCDAICDVMPEYLEEALKIPFRSFSRVITGRCPIHHGDNFTALNIYTDGHTTRGNWYCQTKKCHEKFGKGIIGLTQAILSVQQRDWTPEDGPENQISFREALDFACAYLGVKFDDLKPNEAAIKHSKFLAQNRILNAKLNAADKKIPKAVFRKNLKYPAQYFIDRGYPDWILEHFDVGYCDNPKKPMFRRCVVPVYEETGKFATGFLARATCERCAACGYWHHDDTSCDVAKGFPKGYAKWINDESLDVSSHLYGYWAAIENIRRTGTIVLVEGPGDVWRLWASGMYNAVAMFGTSFTEQQQVILESSGAMNLIVLTDNDDAGNECAKKIYDRCHRIFRLYYPKYSGKDVGELSKDVITKEIEPMIRLATERYKSDEDFGI